MTHPKTVSEKTYKVISTINASIYGWKTFFVGTKTECKKYQLEGQEFNGNDIYADTYNKNSKIVVYN